MALPSILRPRRSHQHTDSTSEKHDPSAPLTQPSSGRPSQDAPSSQHNTIVTANGSEISDEALKRATRVRKGFALLASFSYLISWIFLLLVLIGNTHPRPVLRDIYFFKLILADIIPMSVPNAALINSIAQTIGLHDFYQVGLWNFCEGYMNEGITACSEPKPLYWFDPVSILTSELLSGATIALPSQIVTILSVLRISSQIMFGFFLTSTLLSFLLCPLSPLALSSRWWSLPLAFAAFLNMVLTLSASVVGSVISVAFKYAATAQSELNIRAEVGGMMFVFMWVAAGAGVVGFAVHAGMGCCCTSRRDVKSGRRRVGEDGRVIRW